MAATLPAAARYGGGDGGFGESSFVQLMCTSFAKIVVDYNRSK